jgi:DNA adenine methylase
MLKEGVVHSPIGGFGSKCRACVEARLHEYLPNFPSNRKLYVEPFAFSAVMFLNTNAKRAILNDIDYRIYNFWTVLKNKYDAFMHELECTYAGKSWFDEYEQRQDDVGKAIFFYICNRVAWGGVSVPKFKFKYLINHFQKDLQYIKDRFDAMHSLVVWNFHFRELYRRLLKKGGKELNFVWYIDPPYIIDNGGYYMSMTIEEHEELARLHAQMKDDPSELLIISYNDCPKVRELYDGWFIKEITFSTGSVSRKKGDYKELVISNRELGRRRQSTMQMF